MVELLPLSARFWTIRTFFSYQLRISILDGARQLTYAIAIDRGVIRHLLQAFY
jgi:hypothetical protein